MFSLPPLVWVWSRVSLRGQHVITVFSGFWLVFQTNWWLCITLGCFFLYLVVWGLAWVWNPNQQKAGKNMIPVKNKGYLSDDSQMRLQPWLDLQFSIFSWITVNAFPVGMLFPAGSSWWVVHNITAHLCSCAIMSVLFFYTSWPQSHSWSFLTVGWFWKLRFYRNLDCDV